jgi:hypothetical protein
VPRVVQPGHGKPQGTRTAPTASPPVLLHIGAMKTGTSYLQRMMHANRAVLAGAGYLVPGASGRARGRATRDVMAPTSDELSPGPAAAWLRLAGEMLAHEGAGSVLSHEFLSFATPVQARRIVESFPGRKVRVILTVRDAAGLIPAQWQTNCRNRGKLSFAAFVRGIDRALDGSPDPGKPARLFERTQGVPRMLDAWVPQVGADRVHVVTVPPRGAPPDLLWRRFASVLGVDPEVCATEFDYVNTSLGFASSELLRRVNRELGRVDKPAYDRVVKGPLARRILGARSRLERPIRLHRSGFATAARWNRCVRSAIEAAGVEVVGDLEELPTGGPSDAAPDTLARPRPPELLEAAITARDGLVEMRALLPWGRPPTESPTESHRSVGPVAPTRASDAAGPGDVRAAVHEVTGLVRDCIDRAAADPTAADRSLRSAF